MSLREIKNEITWCDLVNDDDFLMIEIFMTMNERHIGWNYHHFLINNTMSEYIPYSIRHNITDKDLA